MAASPTDSTNTCSLDNNYKITDRDDLCSIKSKLGITESSEDKPVYLKDEFLKYINEYRDSQNNNFLVIFLRNGKENVTEFLLRCVGLSCVNAKNEDKQSAADIAWSMKSYQCLFKLLENDSLFPEKMSFSDDDSEEEKKLAHIVEQRIKLHESIKMGDLNEVMKLTNRGKLSFYFSLNNETVQYCSAINKKLEISAYLQHIEAKYFNGEKEALKEKFPDFFSYEKAVVRAVKDRYCIKDKNSHIQKLKGTSKIKGFSSEEQRFIIENLYEKLNQDSYCATLMKVIEHTDVEIVYDFGSECVERIYHPTETAYGMTDTEKRTIYIGAKKCISSHGADNGVAGTLIHEICHLAIAKVYGNWSKPYKEDDLERRNVYQNILSKTKEMIKKSPDKYDDVIKRVFDYSSSHEAELIVRVPHILALYEKEKGQELLEKQVPDLFKFYTEYVFKDCETYSDPSFFSKLICDVQPLQKFYGQSKNELRSIPPFERGIINFKSYLIDQENFLILVTSSPTLCLLHIYHQLKDSYRFHIEKRCLIFDYACIRKNFGEIQIAFECKVCEYLIIIVEEDSFSYEDLLTGVKHMLGFNNKEIIVILNIHCKSLKKPWKKKALLYKWNDLSGLFKEFLLKKKVLFQGRLVQLKNLISMNMAPEIMKSEVISYIMENGEVEIGDDTYQHSPVYEKESFMERTFVRQTVDEAIEDFNSHSSIFFVTGLSHNELQERGISKRKIQEVGEEKCDLLNRKRFIIPVDINKAKRTFHEFFEKDHIGHTVLWIHYMNDHYYLKKTVGDTRLIEKYQKTQLSSEEEVILDAHKDTERSILVSDDPGSGKTTVMTDLAYRIKIRSPNIWVFRIDLNNYGDNENNPLSLKNVWERGKDPECIIKYFFSMLKISNPLEISLLMEYIYLPMKVKVFFDGFDEISPNYKEETLILLRTLKSRTKIQLWVSTRVHERLDLELELDTVSYHLQPFTFDEQVNFLAKYWKNELKIVNKIRRGIQDGIQKNFKKTSAVIQALEQEDNQQHILGYLNELSGLAEGEANRIDEDLSKKIAQFLSEIDKLDLKSHAETLILRVISTTEDEEKTFTGMPLNLIMLASMSFRNNLIVPLHFDISQMYSEFFNNKIELYLKEKCGMRQDTQASIELLKILRRKILDDHQKISVSIMKPNNAAMERSQEKIEKEWVLGTAVVINVENTFRFIHQTFAEYFFSEWILDMINSGSLPKDLFDEVLSEPRFIVVKKFLNCAFKGKDKMTLNSDFVKKLNMKSTYEKFVAEEYLGNLDKCLNIWKYILEVFEEESCRNEVDDFLSFVANGSWTRYIAWNGAIKMIRILHLSLNDESIAKIFFHSNKMDELLLSAIGEGSIENVKFLLRVIKRVLCIKAYNASSTQNMELKRMEENVDSFFESIKEPYGIEQTKLLIQEIVLGGRNIFHYASMNQDPQVFREVILFMKGILGEEMLSEHLGIKNSRGLSVLDLSASKGHLSTVLQDIKSTMDGCHYNEFLREVTNDNLNLLSLGAEHCSRKVFEWTMEHLIEWLGNDYIKKLFEIDEFGKFPLHYAAVNTDFGVLDKIMKRVQSYMGGESLQSYGMSKDKSQNTIFHLRAASGKPIRDLMYMKYYLKEVKYEELLIEVNNTEKTCLHISAETRDKNLYNFVKDLSALSKNLSTETLEKLLLKTDIHGCTFLHEISKNVWVPQQPAVLKILRKCLTPESFDSLIAITDLCDERVMVVKNGDSEELFLLNGDEVAISNFI